MAGKKASGKTYASKGERPNVSKKTLNGMRRDRPFNVEAMVARETHREFVKQKQGAKLSQLKQRYEQEDAIERNACILFDQYKEAGVSWGTCVQAVKTNWVSNFHEVWGPRLTEKVNETRKLRRSRSDEDNVEQSKIKSKRFAKKNKCERT